MSLLATLNLEFISEIKFTREECKLKKSYLEQLGTMVYL